MEFVRPLEPILIIDDDQSMRSSLTTILTELGYDQVAVATDVAEAKPLLSQLEPEVIFVDIALPDTDGCDCRQLPKRFTPTQSNYPLR